MNTTGKLLVSAIDDLETAIRKIEEAENFENYDRKMLMNSIRLSIKVLNNKLIDCLLKN